MTDERLKRARRVLDVEVRALTTLRDRLDAGVARALDLLLACRGKVASMRRQGRTSVARSRRRSSTGTASVSRSRGSHGIRTLARGDVVPALPSGGPRCCSCSRSSAFDVR
jgi:arabinose-5-phosphate isomerase